MQLELFTSPKQTHLDLEEWRDCVGLPGYSVSSLGRLRNDGNGRVHYGYRTENGYHHFSFYCAERITTHLVHRVVAFAFLPPPLPEQTCVNHRNNIRHDNRASNLEWATRSHNARNSKRRPSR